MIAGHFSVWFLTGMLLKWSTLLCIDSFLILSLVNLRLKIPNKYAVDNLRLQVMSIKRNCNKCRYPSTGHWSKDNLKGLYF